MQQFNVRTVSAECGNIYIRWSSCIGLPICSGFCLWTDLGMLMAWLFVNCYSRSARNEPCRWRRTRLHRIWLLVVGGRSEGAEGRHHRWQVVGLRRWPPACAGSWRGVWRFRRPSVRRSDISWGCIGPNGRAPHAHYVIRLWHFHQRAFSSRCEPVSVASRLLLCSFFCSLVCVFGMWRQRQFKRFLIFRAQVSQTRD